MTQARASQAGAEVLFRVLPRAEATQAGSEVLHRVLPGAEVAQAGVEVLHRVQPAFSVTHAGAEVLFKGVDCTVRWCQIWRIARLDGEVFRFTSKDTDIEYPPGSGTVYRSCGSLVPSASESVSELDAEANMDLAGLVGDGSISQQDLYTGLFDGAVVTAWLVPWQGAGRPRRLLKGTFGAVEQTQGGFKVELLGDGAKLKQTPLVSLIQPGCRWLNKQNGGFGGAFCGKDLIPLVVSGTIDSAVGQRNFVDAARGETAGYFAGGRVTFTSGDNAGVAVEIKDHGAGGAFELWPRVPFALVPGTTYEMTPGCTGMHDASGGTNGCAAWNNKRRYGGFLKVPGGDKRGKAADVRSS